MSKLSFRARALDASKPMPVYKIEDIPDMPEFAAINRAVPQMPTGMEKEEETEHHLQRALSAQQVYGTAEALVIPVPEIDLVGQRYIDQYAVKDGNKEFKPSKQYVHVQPWSMDQEIPDYDMDSEDEQWLNKQSKKLECSALKFETMMDRLEKGSGQTVMTLQEAKALLKEDDDLIIAVYDYWLNKRLRLQHALIPTVKTEKRDGSTSNNPYVAFRRRTEKMQTRKNRKNDETSYEKMLKLRRDLNRALTILELMKRREKSKKELLKLTIEIYEKRYQMQDWEGTNLAEANAQRHKLPAFTIPIHYPRDWGKSEEGGYVRKKRKYEKRKHKQPTSTHHHVTAAASQASTVQLPQYNEVDILGHPADVYSSEDDGLSPQLSASDHEADDDPDGVYAFRRKPGVSYHSPINDGLGNWPWCSQEEGGFGRPQYRYSLSSLTQPRRCIGFVRRRVGRGGRVIIDRAFTPWDDHLTELDLTSTATPAGGWAADYTSHIRDNHISHFRPKTPTEDISLQSSSVLTESLSPNVTMEFDMDSFQNHQEQLLQMQRQQQEQILKQETVDLESSIDLEHSFCSQPTSRFTLDSATAQFAASAVCNSAQELLKTTSTSGATTSTSMTSNNVTKAALVNGPGVDSKTSGLSTSPAANVLQFNFPLTSSAVAKETSTAPLATFTSAAALTTFTSTAPLSNSIIIPSGLNASALSASALVGSALPGLTAKAVTPTPPTILKIGNTPNNRKDTLPKDPHESVNNILKDKGIPMEVT